MKDDDDDSQLITEMSGKHGRQKVLQAQCAELEGAVGACWQNRALYLNRWSVEADIDLPEHGLSGDVEGKSTEIQNKMQAWALRYHVIRRV